MLKSAVQKLRDLDTRLAELEQAVRNAVDVKHGEEAAFLLSEYMAEYDRGTSYLHDAIMLCGKYGNVDDKTEIKSIMKPLIDRNKAFTTFAKATF